MPNYLSKSAPIAVLGMLFTVGCAPEVTYPGDPSAANNSNGNDAGLASEQGGLGSEADSGMRWVGEGVEQDYEPQEETEVEPDEEIEDEAPESEEEEQDDDELEEEASADNGDCGAVEETALAILDAQCAECHSNGRADGAVGNILDPEGMIEDNLIQPGDSEGSRLLVRMYNERSPMPPRSYAVQPVEEDFEALAVWIDECL